MNALLGLAVPVGIMGGLNVVLLAIAAADHSWVALAIGTLLGPLTNLVVAVGLFVVSARLPGWENSSRIRRMLLLAGLAMLGAALDFVAVSSMPLHGC